MNLTCYRAISSIAQKVASLTDCSHGEGIWSNDNLDLLWERNAITTPHELQSCSISREYRAPSWSWASINGPIRFQFRSSEITTVELRTIADIKGYEGGSIDGCSPESQITVSGSLVECSDALLDAEFSLKADNPSDEATMP